MAVPTYIELQVSTPDHPVARERVDEVMIPGAQGYFGVLPGHAPLLTMLTVGELWYRKGQEKTYLSIALGFAEVLPDRVTVLAKLAERPEDIDIERAEAARKRAEERLAHHRSDIDYERARIALLKSIVRLQVGSRGSVSLRTGASKRVRSEG
jgi:F-type H+-transporting ATPase subunit epsilon